MTTSVNSSSNANDNPLFKQQNQAKFRHDSSDLDLFAIIHAEKKFTSYDHFFFWGNSKR